MRPLLLLPLQGHFLFHGTVVSCIVEESCKGGPESECELGYSGSRCGECSESYYKLSRKCKPCDSAGAVVSLMIVLTVCCVLLTSFFMWQALKDPRIGNPLIFLTRLLETLSILSLTVVKWPLSVTTFLSTVSIVNFNTEIFQMQCILGPPHPTRSVGMYACGLLIAWVVAILIWPASRLCKRCAKAICRGVDRDSANTIKLLDEMCEHMKPGSSSDASLPLPFTPTQAVMAANFKEHVKISFTVRSEFLIPLGKSPCRLRYTRCSAMSCRPS